MYRLILTDVTLPSRRNCMRGGILDLLFGE
jgi:hypothetical protein